MKTILAGCLAVMLLAAACATPTPTPPPTPTATPIPTTTPIPTATPAPTATPIPTATSVPTATPIPTVTPEEAERLGELFFDCIQNWPEFGDVITSGMVKRMMDEGGLTEETARNLVAELLANKDFWVEAMTGEEYSEMDWLEEMAEWCEPLATQQM